MANNQINDGYWLGLGINDFAKTILKHLEAIYSALSLTNPSDRSWVADEVRQLKLKVGIEIKLMRRILLWSGNLVELDQEIISKAEMDAIHPLIQKIVIDHCANLNIYLGIPPRLADEMGIPDIGPHFRLAAGELDGLRILAYRYIVQEV